MAVRLAKRPVVVGILALVIGFGAGGAGALTSSAATSHGRLSAVVITGGQTLADGDQVTSPTGHYVLEMQTSGNLAEVEPTGGRLVWQSNTGAYPGAVAVLESDGDLVVQTASGAVLWSDNAPTAGCAALNLLDDGNVEVDGPSGAAWASGTVQNLVDGDYLKEGQVIWSGNHDYELVMQGDGNLVLYNSDSQALWDTGTGGHPGAYAVLQGDGNFVVYSAAQVALWDSETNGHAGDQIDVQDDGNLVIYPASGSFLWDSETNGSAPGTGDIGPVPADGSAAACPAPPAVTATTVTVTTTVETVSPTPGSSKRPAVRVPLAFYWSWRASDSFLQKISFGRLPSRLSWSATIVPGHRGEKSRHLVAETTAARRRLIRWLEHQRYTTGERLEVTIEQPGHREEAVTFEVRLHAVPVVIAHAHAPAKVPPDA